MPYKIDFLDQEGGVITTYWGGVSDADVIQSGRKKFAELDRLKNYRYALTDLSRVEEFKLTSYGIQVNVDLSSKIYEVNSNFIVAFVLPTDVEFGMGRMWQAYSDKYGIKSFVCRSRTEAEEWIQKNVKPKN